MRTGGPDVRCWPVGRGHCAIQRPTYCVVCCTQRTVDFMRSLQTLDIEDVDFAFDDQPNLHAVLARLRARKPYAVVPFAGVPAVLLLTDELVRAAFRDEAAFPAAPVYAMTTEPVFGKTVLSMSGPSTAPTAPWCPRRCGATRFS